MTGVTACDRESAWAHHWNDIDKAIDWNPNAGEFL